MNTQQLAEINSISEKLEILLTNARSFINVAKFINYPKRSDLSPREEVALFHFMEGSELFRKMQIFGWRLFIIEICKIFDRDADISLSNIKNKLIGFGIDVNSDLFDKLRLQNNDLRILAKAKRLRNEYYAHTDEELSPGIDLLFTWTDAENLIITAENCLNYFYNFFNKEKIINHSCSIYETECLWKEEIIQLSGVKIKNVKGAD